MRTKLSNKKVKEIRELRYGEEKPTIKAIARKLGVSTGSINKYAPPYWNEAWNNSKKQVSKKKVIKVKVKYASSFVDVIEFLIKADEEEKQIIKMLIKKL